MIGKPIHKPIKKEINIIIKWKLSVTYECSQTFIGHYLSKQAVFIVSILMNRISVAWAKTWNTNADKLLQN